MSTGNRPYFYFETIDSTNTHVRRLLEGGEPVADGTLFVANEQTAGRGRQGNSFYSPADTGLYLTLVRTVPFPPEHALKLTLAAAVAAVDAIAEVTGVEPSIKWVNDLYLNDRKIAGILTERIGNTYVIGIGINCAPNRWPDDIRGKAGAIADSLEGNTPIDRKQLADVLWQELLRRTDALAAGDTAAIENMMDLYRSRSLLLGKPVRYEQNKTLYEGLAKEIDVFGRLVVSLPDGTDMALDSGEVHVRF